MEKFWASIPDLFVYFGFCVGDIQEVLNLILCQTYFMLTTEKTT